MPRKIDDGHSVWNHAHNYFTDRVSIKADVQKSSSWALLHHGLYHTPMHHDAEGYGTWVQILSGYKIWTFVRPNGHETASSRFELGKPLFEYLGEESNKFMQEATRFAILAGPGDVMYAMYALFIIKLIKRRLEYNLLVLYTRYTRLFRLFALAVTFTATNQCT